MRQQIPDEQKRLQRIQRLSAKLDAAIASSKGQRKLVEELAREAAALAALYSQATIRLREPKAKQTPRALTPRKSTSDSEG